MFHTSIWLNIKA